jgi:hypothetical protein
VSDQKKWELKPYRESDFQFIVCATRGFNNIPTPCVKPQSWSALPSEVDGTILECLLWFESVVFSAAVEVELRLVEDDIDTVPFLREDDRREGLVSQITLLEIGHFWTLGKERHATLPRLVGRGKGAEESERGQREVVGPH